MMETADSKWRPCRAVSEEIFKSLYFQSFVKRIARQSWFQKCSPVLLSFYERLFQRQGSFPVFEREL